MFYRKLQNNDLKIPPDTNLPRTQQEVPYVFVADDAFPLQNHVMKLYRGVHANGSDKRIYNYRLSRARRVVENAFGILSSVFRVLTPMLLQPKKASIVVMACVYLHNFFVQENIYQRQLDTFNSRVGEPFRFIRVLCSTSTFANQTCIPFSPI